VVKITDFAFSRKFPLFSSIFVMKFSQKFSRKCKNQNVRFNPTLLQQPRLFPTYAMRDAGPQHKADGIFSYTHVENFLHSCWKFPTLMLDISYTYPCWVPEFPTLMMDFSDVLLYLTHNYPVST
jgi:hypothetical protein